MPSVTFDFRRAIASMFGSLLVMACCATAAKSTNFRAEDRYNLQHIASLPPDIRAFIFARCGEPRALHSFAEYRDNLRIVILHFEHFLCGTLDFQCFARGCLHEIYVMTRSGRYKLVHRYYAKDTGI